MSWNDGRSMNIRPGSTRPFYHGSEQSLLCSARSRLALFGHSVSQARPVQDHGSLYSSSFPAPMRVQVSFVYAERKEETWRICGRTGCAHSKVLGFSFTFLAVARKKESERLGHNGLPFFYFVVCARFYVD